MKTDTHIECISDFCGNAKSSGAWADIFQRQDGSKYIGLGGGWSDYCENPPKTIEESSPHYLLFIAACDTGDDFGYARENFKK